MKTLLLSGGRDSALIAAERCDELDAAITFSYGQPHKIELDFARRVAEKYRIPHHFIVSLPDLGMTPEDPEVGARNLLFMALAKSLGATEIYLGANAADQRDFPDCRPEYLEKVQDLLGVPVKTPLLSRTKGEILDACLSHDILDMTWSCYDPQEGLKPCYKCGACRAEAAND